VKVEHIVKTNTCNLFIANNKWDRDLFRPWYFAVSCNRAMNAEQRLRRQVTCFSVRDNVDGPYRRHRYSTVQQADETNCQRPAVACCPLSGSFGRLEACEASVGLTVPGGVGGGPVRRRPGDCGLQRAGASACGHGRLSNMLSLGIETNETRWWAASRASIVLVRRCSVQFINQPDVDGRRRRTHCTRQAVSRIASAFHFRLRRVKTTTEISINTCA